MCTETVEQRDKAGYVEAVPNMDSFSVEVNNSCAMTKNRNVQIVAHANLKARDDIVEDEGRFDWENMVHGPGVRHCKATIEKGGGG